MTDGDHLSLNQRVAAGVRAELARSGMSRYILAQHLGISVNALSRRIDDKVSFKVDEVDAICHLFKIGPHELIRLSFILDAVRIKANEVIVERR